MYDGFTIKDYNLASTKIDVDINDIAKAYRNCSILNAIIYDQDCVLNGTPNKFPVKRSVSRTHHKVQHINSAASKIMYKEFIKERHICPLLVLLDNCFLTVVHKNDITAAVSQVLLSVNEVNSVFRSTDFDEDGNPDNIGFIVKYLVIIESEDSPTIICHLILQNLEVCLGVLFTAQSFQESVLGVSYSAVSEADASNEIIGGICQRPFTSYMLSLNAVAVSYISMQGVHLPQSTLDTCLTHELGHAFGCRHDRKSDPGYNEEYLMSSHTLSGTSAKNFQFSSMSKKHLVMTVPRKGHCLLKSTESFCGNGIVDKGEECDCGAKHMCKFNDPCCIPSGMHGACHINRLEGHQCHPSQGYCCSEDCKYERFEKIGLNCKLMENKCPCAHEGEECDCGIGGICLGSECQSEECARIDAAECICSSNPKEKSCNICCLANPDGPCLTSRNLTSWKLAMGLITIKQLEIFVSHRILPNITVFEKFCHGIECVTLGFKNSKLGNYCLRNGKVGMCTTEGCIIRTVEVFEKENLGRNLRVFKSLSMSIFRSSRVQFVSFLLLIKYISQYVNLFICIINKLW
ncbi:hypothetical protein HHI36_003355 [Cryptolaemus montrouzieri]|uniref:Disintegrin and metalloproteinase domain-containing protein 10 n=1 Tax=Cryptolaemus montrouzieri TaxID=559131 RepID=A0ABD2PDX4_9CUCU